eukprot:scaffold104840_cov53-Attheya_sp.AAC.2
MATRGGGGGGGGGGRGGGFGAFPYRSSHQNGSDGARGQQRRPRRRQRKQASKCEVFLKVSVDRRGLLIGRGGATIQHLRTTMGTTIEVPGRREAENVDHPVKIRGPIVWPICVACVLGDFTFGSITRNGRRFNTIHAKAFWIG